MGKNQHSAHLLLWVVEARRLVSPQVLVVVEIQRLVSRVRSVEVRLLAGVRMHQTRKVQLSGKHRHLEEARHSAKPQH